MPAATLQSYYCKDCRRSKGGTFDKPPACPVCRKPMEKDTRKQEFRGIPYIGGTDSIFARGLRLGSDDGFDGDELISGMARAEARAAGVNPTGKKFFPSLCREGKPLDPLAWQDSRSGVAKRVRELGKGCEGLVNVPLPIDDKPHPLDKPFQIAPDIVAEEVQMINTEQYEGRMPKKVKADLTDTLTKKRSGRG